MGKAVRGPVFRTPFLLLAILNLGMLAARLWPWSTAAQLAGNSDVAMDPVIALLGYVILAFWIGSVRGEQERKVLLHSAILGVVAGAVLAGAAIMGSAPPSGSGSQNYRVQLMLLGAAVLIWIGTGMRARRLRHSVGFAMVCAAWSAMVSALVGCAELLAQTFSAASPDQMPDPWGDLQQRIMGTAYPPLTHTLKAVTGFLLVLPLAACIAGAVFSAVVRPRKEANS